jgi:DNA polymerase III delta subunit
VPVIILAGEEEFLLSRRLLELKSTLLSSPWQTINFIKLDSPNLANLREVSGTLPFGQGKRIVSVDNCQLFTKKRTKVSAIKADKASRVSIDSATEEDFESILSSVPENTYLIFCCPYNFDSTLRLAKLVSKFGQIEEFPKEKYFPGSRSAKLEAWCRQEAKKCNATIDDAAIEYLLLSSEVNLRQIASEIEKVSLSILPKTQITYENVANTCSAQGHIFQFIDLWLSGQKNEALDNLQELLAQQSAMPILATLQTMLGKWIKLKALYEEYSSGQTSLSPIAKQIATDLKLLPFSVEKDLRRLSKYRSDDLVKKRWQLTHLEYCVKTGQVADQHALALFVLS